MAVLVTAICVFLPTPRGLDRRDAAGPATTQTTGARTPIPVVPLARKCEPDSRGTRPEVATTKIFAKDAAQSCQVLRKS
jgi:hypothetical protein